MQSQQKFVAVDREVLLGINVGVPDHRVALDFLRSLKFLPMATPIVRAVIADMEENDEDAPNRMWAQRVLQDIWDSDIVTPHMNDTYHQVIDIHSDKLIHTGVLKGGNKVDARTVVEASYFDAQVLLTTNPVIRDADHDSLKLVLLECGVGSGLLVVSPAQLVQYMRNRGLIQ